MFFVLLTVYPAATKLLEHRLAHDWAHSALHFCSALLAAYAGWFGPPLVSRLYVAGIALCYGILGCYGWFIDGLFLGTPIAIPLGPVDNVFHLLLAIPAVVITIVGARQTAPSRT